MTTRVALYARTSGDDRERDSIAAQLDACRQFASARDWTIAGEFTEDERGTSGAKLDRPALNELLALAAAGGVDVVLARDRGRIARDTFVGAFVRRELRQYGVAIEYVWGGGMSDSDEGETFDDLAYALEASERRRISRRLATGRRRSVESGSIFIGGPFQSPYGYAMVKDGKMRSLVIDEAQAVVVRDIFRWYAGTVEERSLSLRAIATRLNERGEPAPAGGRWNVMILRRILKDAKFRGRFEYKSKAGTLVLDCPAIIDDDTWFRAQARFESNLAERSGIRIHDYLVGNRATCGDCGHRMSGRQAGKYYRCNCAEVQIGVSCDCANRKFYRVDAVDGATWRFVWEALTNPANVIAAHRHQLDAQAQRQEPSRRQLARVEAALDAEQRQLARLLDLYVRGEWDADVLDAKRADIQRRIDTLERERGDILADIDTPALTVDELQAILDAASALLDRIQQVERADDFGVRRRIIEALDVRVTLWTTDEGRKTMLLASRLNPDGVVIAL